MGGKGEAAGKLTEMRKRHGTGSWKVRAIAALFLHASKLTSKGNWLLSLGFLEQRLAAAAQGLKFRLVQTIAIDG
jgi:hypothetical protein